MHFVNSRFRWRSLQNIRNNRDPRHDPCGAPYGYFFVRVAHFVIYNALSSHLSVCQVAFKTSPMLCDIYHKISSFLNSVLYSNMSNAFDKSRNTEMVCSPFSLPFRILPTNSDIACSQECLLRKPYWLS